MRIARTLPRSSVTWWLSSGRFGQGRWSVLVGSLVWSGSRDDRALGGRDREAEAREGRGGLRGTGRGRGAVALANARDGGADAVGRGGRELLERVAHDPRTVAVPGAGGRRGLLAQERDRRRLVHERQRTEGPREGLLDVRLRVADEIAQDGEAPPGDLRCA